jgi:hypothetical protein
VRGVGEHRLPADGQTRSDEISNAGLSVLVLSPAFFLSLLSTNPPDFLEGLVEEVIFFSIRLPAEE